MIEHSWKREETISHSGTIRTRKRDGGGGEKGKGARGRDAKCERRMYLRNDRARTTNTGISERRVWQYRVP